MTTQNSSAYSQITVSCSNCGHTFDTSSTHDGDLRIEVCSSCHPAYTGEQRRQVSSGQIDKFRQRYSEANQ